MADAISFVVMTVLPTGGGFRPYPLCLPASYSRRPHDTLVVLSSDHDKPASILVLAQAAPSHIRADGIRRRRKDRQLHACGERAVPDARRREPADLAARGPARNAAVRAGSQTCRTHARGRLL